MQIKVIADEGEYFSFPYGLTRRSWDGDTYYLIPLNFFIRLWRWIYNKVIYYRPAKQEIQELTIYFEGKRVADDYLYEKLINDGPDKLIEFMISNHVDQSIVLSNMKHGIGDQPGNMWLCSHCDYKNQEKAEAVRD